MKQLLSTRIGWIDVCRGLAILLVLYGHAFTNDTQRFLIYAFHMPLFFFLSGVVFRQDRSKHITSTFNKNLKSILYPYFIFAIITYIVSLVIFPPTTLDLGSIQKQLVGIIYGNGNEGYLAFNVALWFLPCLFITKVTFGLITRYITNKRLLIMLLVLISIVGYVLSSMYQYFKLPFGIETALTAIVFFGTGYMWNQSTKIKQFMTKRSIVLLFISLTITIMFAWFNFYSYGTQIDMRLNRLNNYFFFYISAFSGIAVCLLTSIIIKKNTLLEYLGKHSMMLFVWHTLLFSYFFKHGFPPVHITFITPTLIIIFASSIILSVQLMLERIKLAKLYRGI